MFKVEITKSGMFGTHVKVSKGGICRIEYVTSVLGNVDDKARKVANKIVDQWKCDILERKNKIEYTVEFEIGDQI